MWNRVISSLRGQQAGKECIASNQGAEMRGEVAKPDSEGTNAGLCVSPRCVRHYDHKMLMPPTAANYGTFQSVDTSPSFPLRMVHTTKGYSGSPSEATPAHQPRPLPTAALQGFGVRNIHLPRITSSPASDTLAVNSRGNTPKHTMQSARSFARPDWLKTGKTRALERAVGAPERRVEEPCRQMPHGGAFWPPVQLSRMYSLWARIGSRRVYGLTACLKIGACRYCRILLIFLLHSPTLASRRNRATKQDLGF